MSLIVVPIRKITTKGKDNVRKWIESKKDVLLNSSAWTLYTYYRTIFTGNSFCIFFLHVILFESTLVNTVWWYYFCTFTCVCVTFRTGSVWLVMEYFYIAVLLLLLLKQRNWIKQCAVLSILSQISCPGWVCLSITLLGMVFKDRWPLGFSTGL